MREATTIRYRDEYASAQWKELGQDLGAAYLTDHGQLLCSGCVDRNKSQFARAGIGLVVVPCHGIVECTLCGRSASEN